MLFKIIVALATLIPFTLSVDIRNVPEDGRLNFTGLALKYVGAIEEYDVTTEDGYVLKIYHIPGNKSRPVLLMHGILATSDDFIIRGKDSLAVTLAKSGFDLWFGNYRGNRYSRRHTSLNPDTNSTFWKFGPYEHGYYDLAATVDFVLKKTGKRQLSLIGYSEGTTITYILASERQEYNDKIKVFIALAPICHVDKMRDRLPILNELSRYLVSILGHFNINEMVGYDSISGALARNICAHTTVGLKLCRRFLLFVTGQDAEGLEPDFVPTLFYHYPAGTSKMNLEQFIQILRSKRFAKFDYGPVKNLKKYRSVIAPEYDLDKVTIKTYLIVGKNDRLSLLEDSRLQAKELANVMEYVLVEKDNFNHIDFLWSRQSRHYVHPKVVDILRMYT